MIAPKSEDIFRQFRTHPLRALVLRELLNPSTLALIDHPIPSSNPQVKARVDTYIANTQTKLQNWDLDPIPRQEYQFRRPIYLAAKYGQIPELIELLRRGFPLLPTLLEEECELVFPLYVAAKYGHVDMVVILILLGHPMDELSYASETAFQAAVNYKHLPVVKALLQMDPSGLNHPDLCGRTPLHLASFREESKCGGTSEEMVQFLLAAGAEIGPDGSGNSPIHHAAIDLNFRLIQILHSADSKWIMHQNDDGRTPLHLACEMADSEFQPEAMNQTFHLLLRLGPESIYSMDPHGHMPFHVAVQAMGSNMMIAFLKAAHLQGLDLNIDEPTMDGATPLELAITHYLSYQEMIDPASLEHHVPVHTVLKAVGANTNIVGKQGRWFGSFGNRDYELLQAPVSEECRFTIRHSIYFESTLVDRLLAAII